LIPEHDWALKLDVGGSPSFLLHPIGSFLANLPLPFSVSTGSFFHQALVLFFDVTYKKVTVLSLLPLFFLFWGAGAKSSPNRVGLLFRWFQNFSAIFFCFVVQKTDFQSFAFASPFVSMFLDDWLASPLFLL